MARKCPVCGSRKWRKDAISGSVVCEDGHVLQGIRSENLVTEATGHALQKRRLVKGPRINKRKVEGRRDKTYLHGPPAEYLRIQGLQLLLRYQVQELQRLWQLPDVIEQIARDLWHYQLLRSILPDPPGAGPSRDSRDATPVSSPSTSRPGTPGGGRKRTEASDEESDSDSSTEHDPSVSNSDSESVAELEDDVEAQLSSDSDGSISKALPGGTMGVRPVTERRRLRVADTLSTLILTLWIMRVPFTYRDIESLVNLNQIPYIDFAKSTLVPPEMAKHMNRDVKLSLRPTRSPTPLALWESTQKFARILTRRYCQTIPEINLPPVSWSVISRLGGTATTHAQALKILELINANMGIVDTHTIRLLLRRSKSHSGVRNSDSPLKEVAERPTRYQDVTMPELSIAAAWVVVMKLAYGLDGTPRLALLSSDPLIGMPKRDKWVNELKQRLHSGVLKGEANQGLEKKRFDVMAADEMDRFLDQCEDVLLKNHIQPHPGPYFPLPQVERIAPKVPSPNSWAQFQTLAAADPVQQADQISTFTPNKQLPLMPGEETKRFEAADVTGTLPTDLEIVLDAAAAVVGVERKDVATVVELFERRLEDVRPKREPQRYAVATSSPAVRRVVGNSQALRASRSMDNIAG